jgi:hypothetical protein
MQRTLILATVAALVSFTGLAQAAEAQAMSWQQGLSRTDLMRQDLGDADREVIQARIDFDRVSPRRGMRIRVSRWRMCSVARWSINWRGARRSR